MPLNASGFWTNYTASNCGTKIVNGIVTLVNTSFNNLTGAGLLCTPWTNIGTIFWPAIILTLYVVTFFLFSYLNSMKLFVVTASIMWLFCTILLAYGFIGGIIWMGAFGLMVISVIILYFSNRG